MAKAKEAFYQNEVKQLRKQLEDANKDIGETNRALAQLRQVQSIQYNGKTFNREPQLNDKMKEYQYITIGVVGVGLGYLLSRYL